MQIVFLCDTAAAFLILRKDMKAGIHPTTQTAKVTCSCGKTFEIGNSTITELHVEVCSACHPHYTGKQKLVDTAGRVDKFNKKWAAANK